MRVEWHTHMLVHQLYKHTDYTFVHNPTQMPGLNSDANISLVYSVRNECHYHNQNLSY